MLPKIGLVALLLVGAAGIWAQSASATLTAEVVDGAGAPVRGAAVVLTDLDRNQESALETGPDGIARFPNLRPAAYRLTASAQGYLTAKAERVPVTVNLQASVRLTLPSGVRRDSIEVMAEAGPVVMESPAVRTVVDRQFVGEQPLNGRTMQSLIALAPGVVVTAASLPSPGQFSVNGQRPSSNNFQVDGVSANFGTSASVTPYEPVGGTVPALTALGTTTALASMEAMQEFAIQTSTYAPEFGRQPGGQVSIVTRSGANAYHGSLFEYFRNDKLDANNWFANANGLPRNALRQNDFGGSLGGRVVRDRTFFFAAHESLLLRSPFVTPPLTVPSLAARQQATGAIRELLNGFPLPIAPALPGDPLTTPYIATVSNPASLHSTSGRVDHRIGDRLQMFGRASVAPSQNRERAKFCATSCVSVTDVDVQTYTGGVTWTVTPRLVSDLRLNYSTSKTRLFYDMDSFGGAVIPAMATLYPAFTDRDKGYIYVEVDGAGDNTLSDGLFVNNRQRQWNFVETISYNPGRHSLKFGVDWRRLNPLSDSGSYRRQFRYANLGQLVADRAPTGALFAPDVVMEPLYANWSFFAQDSWRASDRLTLTYGVRYEVAPSPEEANGKMPATAVNLNDAAAVALAPAGKRFYETDWSNFAPRFGAALRLDRAGTWVLRGGAGLFYDLGYGFTGNAFSTSLWPYTRTATYSNVAYADTRMSSQPPAVNGQPPYPRVFAYEDGFRTPRILQFNGTVAKQWTANDQVSVAYVGAIGRRLARIEQLRGYNPRFTRIDAVRSNAESSYHALQVQYDRRLSRGLQALATYTWGKSLDTASDESINNFQAPAQRLDPRQDQGPSSFDLRQTFNVAVSYEFARGTGWRRALGGFALDGIFRARTAAPVNVLTGRDPFGLGITTVSRPDAVYGAALYLEDANVAGGKRFNPAALDSATPVAQGRQGTLGRNVLRGFGAAQVDLAARRVFRWGERWNLQMRAELFNVTNTPNFANPPGVMTGRNFGRSTQMLSNGLGGLSALYQQGGPRSAQLALRLSF
jgi:hypothetical protein